MSSLAPLPCNSHWRTTDVTSQILVAGLPAGITLSAAQAPLPAAAPTAVTRTPFDIAALIDRQRVQEHPAAARDNPRWRRPQKIVLLAWGFGGWEGRLPALQAAAPGVQIVSVGDPESARREVADADAIVGFNPMICDAQILNAARALRWVQSLSAGVETCIPLPAIRQPGLLVTNMRGMDSPAIAEHAISLMMALAHGLDVFGRDTARGVWSRESLGGVQMQMLEGKTLLVAGLGSIGTEVARRAAGLGMRVVATREGGGPQPTFVSRIGQPGDLLTLAREADVVINCLPLTPATTGLFDARFFAVAKPSMLFINIARGQSVVTADLVAALNERRIAAAGLDVAEPEPLPAGHPLWQAPRVLITPHISSATDLPGEERWEVLAENLRRYAAGERMLQVVDVQRGY